MNYVWLRERFLTEMTLSLQLVKAFDRTPTKLSEFEYLETNVICEFVIIFFTKNKEIFVLTRKDMTGLEIILIISEER